MRANFNGILHSVNQPETVPYKTGGSGQKQMFVIREPYTGNHQNGKDQYIEIEAFGDKVGLLTTLQLGMEVNVDVNITGTLKQPRQGYDFVPGAWNRVKLFNLQTMNQPQQAPQAPQGGYQQNAPNNQQNYNAPAQPQQQAPQQQAPQQNYNTPAQPRQAANVPVMTPPNQIPQQNGQSNQPYDFNRGPQAMQQNIQQGAPAGTFEAPAQGGYQSNPQQEDDIPF